MPGHICYWLNRKYLGHDDATGKHVELVRPGSRDGPLSTLLVVDDPDAIFAQTVSAGAAAASEMADEHGWRLGRIIDPFGHEWEIGTPLGPWPPR
jgi:PhnB protein